MEHDINKINRILLAKRKKYSILSFFFRQKYLVVDFIPLDEIVDGYCQKRKILRYPKKIISYLPKTLGKDKMSIQHFSPAVELYLLKNVLVPGDSSFFLTKEKDKIFFEKHHDDHKTIYKYDHKNIAFHSDNLAKIRNFEVVRHHYDIIYFGGTFSFNYYHFVIEILSKTAYLHHIPNHKNIKIILDCSIQNNTNLRALAEYFFRDYPVEYIDHNFYHQYNKIWYISSPNSTVPNVVESTNYEASYTKLCPETISYLQKEADNLFNQEQVNIFAISKVFMARKSDLRKYNEKELLEIAEKYGFVAVYFEDLNIHEQIFIMKNADFIVGASGAAWTNLLFAKPKSKGLTWLGTVWGDFSVFSTLAEIVNFDLHYIRNKSNTDFFHEDYIIDTQIFEEQLINLLNYDKNSPAF